MSIFACRFSVEPNKVHFDWWLQRDEETKLISWCWLGTFYGPVVGGSNGYGGL